MTVALVSTERLLELHRRAIAMFPTSTDPNLVPREGCLEGAIGNAENAAAYEQEEDADEPDHLRIAVYLFAYLVKNHCFTDGNKRVAWMAFVDYMHHFGLTVDADEEVAAAFVNQIASGQGTQADYAHAWLVDRITSAPE